jgi:hypothetical protein
MRKVLLLCSIVFVLSGCENEEKSIDSFTPVNWEKHLANLKESDSLVRGSSYLSVYSEIYSITEHRSINLTVTASIRNVSSTDTIYVESANYYNTAGDLIRTYVDHPIFLKPLETIEIVINEKDTHGGSGANFIFEWAHKKERYGPTFDAVMISTSGQQGISFTTQGVNR